MMANFKVNDPERFGGAAILYKFNKQREAETRESM
jgi:hypothetical protein